MWISARGWGGGLHQPPADILRHGQRFGEVRVRVGQGETGAEGEAEDDMGMNEMFNFQTVLTFDKPVSKVKSKIGEYNADSKEVVFNYNLKQAIEESKDWTTTITLGK